MKCPWNAFDTQLHERSAVCMLINILHLIGLYYLQTLHTKPYQFNSYKGKGKAFPLQAVTGPQGIPGG